MQPPESQSTLPPTITTTTTTTTNTTVLSQPSNDRDDQSTDRPPSGPDVDMGDAEGTPSTTPARVQTPTARPQHPLSNSFTYTYGNGNGSGGNSGVGVTGPTPTTHTQGRSNLSHGAPARRYLNTHVSRVLIEGVKKVGREQPSDPLRMLGEFLLQKSREIEGSTTTGDLKSEDTSMQG